MNRTRWVGRTAAELDHLGDGRWPLSSLGSWSSSLFRGNGRPTSSGGHPLVTSRSSPPRSRLKPPPGLWACYMCQKCPRSSLGAFRRLLSVLCGRLSA